MRSLRVGLAQINATVGDLDGNFDRIVAAIGAAREQGVELLAFPEMALAGYPPEDLLLKPRSSSACSSARATCCRTRAA